LQFLTVDPSGTPREFTVEGTTFAPHGSVASADGKEASAELRSEPIQRLAEISSICNDAKIVYNAVRPFPFHPLPNVYTSSAQEKGVYSNIGEPTEAALRVLAEKLPCPDAELAKNLTSLPPADRANAVNQCYERALPRLLTFEFSRDRKMMSVLVKRGGAGALFVKGAPESVLDRCTSAIVNGHSLPMTPALRDRIMAHTVAYANQGLRTLALAYADVADPAVPTFKVESTADYARFERDLVFVSVVGMLDPPRPEVRGAVANCKAAGIRVICITGDNKITAETICRQIGIFGKDEDLTGKSYTGRELDALSPEEKVKAVMRASLFSRTEPGHKSQLVDLLQGQGLVVAMVSLCRARAWYPG
jgi:P-type Ca2+ transporter type 2A